MRTRRSSRIKNKVSKPPDVEVSAEEPETPVQHPAAPVAEDDADFDDAAAAAANNDDDEENANGGSIGNVNDDNQDAQDIKNDTGIPIDSALLEEGAAASTPRKPRRRARPPAARIIRRGPPAYLQFEPVPSDSHAVKSYVGPYERFLRSQSLVAAWFGPHQVTIDAIQWLLERWIPWTVLPPKALCHDASPRPDTGGNGLIVLGQGCYWRPGGAIYQAAKQAQQWQAQLPPAIPRRRLDDSASVPFSLPDQMIPVLLGPHDAPQAVEFWPGGAVCLSRTGLPLSGLAEDGATDSNAAAALGVDDDDEDEEIEDSKVPIGWMLDTGGIVIGMDWAPYPSPPPVQQQQQQQNQTPSSLLTSPQTQLLALAVIPHADQELYNYEIAHQQPDFERYGVVQLWALHGERRRGGRAGMRPSTRRMPVLCRRLCFDGGRARRVRWSPAGRHLAVLCGDGSVRVVDAGDVDEAIRIDSEYMDNGAYEMVDEPLATLILNDHVTVRATCLAWCTYNRLVVGYKDGSLCLWSVSPPRLLGRHAVHHSDVIDVATGAPTMPYLTASSPVGGALKLVDLRSPSYERTEVQVNAVHTQPNMMAWSDHLLGFFCTSPSANALNTLVGFVNHRHGPLVRRIFSGDCFPSCLAAARTHPCLLIGATDGSLWSLNPVCELFKARRPPQNRIRIFQHEHRPPQRMPSDPTHPPPARGAARILHGFGIEKNTHIVLEGKSRIVKKTAGSKGASKGAKRRNDDGDGDQGEEDDDDDGGDDDDDEMEGAGGGGGGLMDPKRGVIHEALTRITVVEWNPNPGFGCWAAAALGSGLVRVLDLGLEGVAE